MVAKFSLEDRIIARSLSRKLKPKQRCAVMLRFWHGCSILEVARSLGVTWDEADRMIKDALDKLKQGCTAQPHFLKGGGMILKKAKVMLDVFKGRQGKDERVVKVRSVGYGQPILITYKLSINGLAPNSHILMPEEDIEESNDYVIYQCSPHVRGVQQVGIGYLMSGSNAGLIELEWDIYGNADIYLDLWGLATERRAS